MDDEFKLCWKNFQDNIASGFQSLYDRGDLVDVTLACDGKLLQAHKIVLAICSPYFQEIFITNPCKHPIIILKDVSYTIMCELLEFMYQGVVNVKHTELQAFMKIGQLLQIKGLATNSSSSAASTLSDKSTINHNTNSENESPSQPPNNTPKSAVSPSNDAENNNEEHTNNNPDKPPRTPTNSNTPQRAQSPAISPVSPSLNISSINQKMNDSQIHHSFHQGSSAGGAGHKRHLSDFNSESLSIYSRNKVRRSLAPTDHSSENNDGSDVGGSSSMDQMNTEDFFLPHISMVEARYDLNNVKRESADHHLHPNSPTAAAAAAAAASLRNSFNPAAFGLDYTFYKNNSGSSQGGQEYPNDLNISGDFSKGFANHMDIPPNCPNVVMLSSTSLLHGHCVFNRNNTVATQQGMKTYWLCKSYRISMCRARCITHQGKIISATGVHNHLPHMRGNNGGGGVANNIGPLADGNISGGTGCGGSSNNTGGPPPPSSHAPGGGSGVGLRFAQNIGSPSANMFQPSFHGPHHGHPMSPSTPPSLQHGISVADATTMNSTTSHHFVQSMSNLGQHHHGSQASQLLPPTTGANLTFQPPPNNVIPTIMHGSTVHSPQTHPSYDMSPPTDHDHNRSASQQTFDANGKSLKIHVNDDHIPVHNAAELSPSNVHDDSDPHLIKSTSEQHHQQQHQHLHQHQHQHQTQHLHQPVQVIDSITISPGGNTHNFKMEPL